MTGSVSLWLKAVASLCILLLGVVSVYLAALNILAVYAPAAIADHTVLLPNLTSQVARGLVKPEAPIDYLQRAAALASRSVKVNALDGETLAVLALVEEKRTRLVDATKIMIVSADLTPHYPMPHFWLFDRALQSGDFYMAAKHLDILFRTRPEAIDPVFDAIDKAGSNSDLLQAIAIKLSQKPYWRRRFLDLIIHKSSDHSSAIILFDKLRLIGDGVQMKELAPLLWKMVQANRAAQAYVLWFQHVVDETVLRVDHVYNGSFESDPSESPFDWQVFSLSSGSVSYEVLGDGPERSIVLEFYEGRHTGFQLNQTLVLTPGKWLFAGRARVEDLTAPRGLNWNLICRPSGVETEVSPRFQGSEGTWIDFRQEFTVPPAGSGCDFQELALRIAGRAEADGDFRGRISSTGLQMQRISSTVDPAIVAPDTLAPTNQTR